MQKQVLLATAIIVLSWTMMVGANDAPVSTGISLEVRDDGAARQVRSQTTICNGRDDSYQSLKTPTKQNTRLLGQVLWIDRNHENAVAENVSIAPDGANITAGWWLNNERVAAYHTVGLSDPAWRFNFNPNWQIPVDNSNINLAAAPGLAQPFYLWNVASPMFQWQNYPDGGWSAQGVSFSGNGLLMAGVAALGAEEGKITVFNVETGDTLFTRDYYPDTGLYGVDFSADGSVVVVSCYRKLYVYEVPSGNLRATIDNYSQNIAKISGDGSVIVIGDFNGYFKAYRWAGSAYQLAVNHYSGHSWVVGLAVSDDGTTGMCGTLGFNPYRGKTIMYDLTGNSVLWQYEQYGDYVGGCALSADGSIGVAVSWGQYGATFGDVLTVFSRASNTPIFKLQDDIDEPGSLFNVDISTDGHYVTAGGKAVHAREFGNGGMLYSIKVNDPLAHDVAVASINTPGEFVAPGDSIMPQATFMNIGTSTESFTVRCVITNLINGCIAYNQTATISNLGSMQSQEITFSPPTAPPDGIGLFEVKFIAELPGDQDFANNSMAINVRIWHDIQTSSINFPLDSISVNIPASPMATFKNWGSFAETFDATCVITDTLMSEIYHETITISGLSPYSETNSTFPQWLPETIGSYNIRITADVADDYHPDDNESSKPFKVVQQLFYDDGGNEANYWVGTRVNDKFAVRFSPNMPEPYAIDKGWIFIGSSNYSYFFDYVALVGDDSGEPDTMNVLARIDNPEGVPPGTWLEFDFNNPVIVNSDDFWMIVHWPDGNVSDPPPTVGADGNVPIDGRSSWYNDNNGFWTPFTSYDWMMRVLLTNDLTGITEELPNTLPKSYNLLANFPNPFNPSTEIGYELPELTDVNLSVYNILGQRVKTLINMRQQPGIYSVNWDGRDGEGHDISSGIYFYRLTTNNFDAARQMMLVK